MLLAVAAACAGETVEVPGETVVVEKVVTETVEVPGETVVVEKEVIKTVEVPGETVTKEVVKEVMVPGETVVVKEEVVKTVEVPGETVTVEVVKEVMVPGETVVVEKEVVKTVEVPGQTVVVEKEVVKEVRAGYVTDPSTGKAVSAPQYGGTLTLPYKSADLFNPDPFYDGGRPQWLISGVQEKLGIGNWAIDRDEFDFSSFYYPFNVMIGNLAESWETPDPLTIVFHIRKGVHWHNKAPMNGRELTAKDVEFTFRRIKGWGEEGVPLQTYEIFRMPIESITATDKWTVVVKMEQPSLDAVPSFTNGTMAFILPPEVIEQHGDYQDWRNMVGTGPFMLTDLVEGVSMTRIKNPDYWGYDEKYPENRLPYVDEVRHLYMGDEATLLAALRTAKIDMAHNSGRDVTVVSIDSVRSLQRTNPELQVGPFWLYNTSSAAMNLNKPPFDDIRVRQAMQMALDLETINPTYYSGFANATPTGVMGHELTGFHVPFEEWPEEVKKTRRYDPEGAEALLDAAGYPRGADGIRFKTTYVFRNIFDIGIIEVLVGYWDVIGVDVKITPYDSANWAAALRDQTYEMATAAMGLSFNPASAVGAYSWVEKGVSSGGAPELDAAHDGFFAATTVEEQQKFAKDYDMFIIRNQFFVQGPKAPIFQFAHPWVIGWNGESNMVPWNDYSILARLWIDHELKEAMGH